MKKNWLFIFTGVLLLVISLYWGISGAQWLEPWTAVLSAVLFLLGLIYPAESNDSGTSDSVAQTNFFSFRNTSKVKKAIGRIRQMNIFSSGNKQEIEK